MAYFGFIWTSMIKDFMNRLMGKNPSKEGPDFGSEKRIAPSVHGINPQELDERALQVVSTLQDKGYEAYVVGGAVRDLLLGLAPKDFDVATNATPEQVKACFRRAFIIGKRFRIVHVVFGRGREHDVIEVSTFRAHLESSKAKKVSGNEKTSKHALAHVSHAVDASGRVLRDNVWGPQEEDAARRDFTVNAMYYDPSSGEVVDYHKGIQDAKKKVIRMIGDPATRYREDPVRIIRAIRFAAKLSPLGFKLESKTAAPLKKMVGLLADVPQSRMFDEMLKLLQTGHAMASIEQLKLHGLASGVYPLMDMVVSKSNEPFVRQALDDTDRRVREQKSVAPSFLLASVLWSDVRQSWNERVQQRQALYPALQDAIDEVFNTNIGDVSGRGKLGADMREIWSLQPRFEKRMGSSPLTLIEQPRFRAAFDFMRLRVQSGELEDELGEWWDEFSLSEPQERVHMLEAFRLQQQKAQSQVARSKPAVKRVLDPIKHNPAVPLEEAGLSEHTQPSSTAPAKRRRRRKPKTEGGPDTGSPPHAL
jgi:poly(A) polymerase